MQLNILIWIENINKCSGMDQKQEFNVVIYYTFLHTFMRMKKHCGRFAKFKQQRYIFELFKINDKHVMSLSVFYDF